MIHLGSFSNDRMTSFGAIRLSHFSRHSLCGSTAGGGSSGTSSSVSSRSVPGSGNSKADRTDSLPFQLVVIREWGSDVDQRKLSVGDLTGRTKVLVGWVPSSYRFASQDLQQLDDIHLAGITASVSLHQQCRRFARWHSSECSGQNLTVESIIRGLILVHLDR